MDYGLACNIIHVLGKTLTLVVADQALKKSLFFLYTHHIGPAQLHCDKVVFSGEVTVETSGCTFLHDILTTAASLQDSPAFNFVCTGCVHFSCQCDCV